jgi:hypothetical protein
MLVTTLVDFDVYAEVAPNRISSDGDGSQFAAVANEFGRAHAGASNNLATSFASAIEGIGSRP